MKVLFISNGLNHGDFFKCELISYLLASKVQSQYMSEYDFLHCDIDYDAIYCYNLWETDTVEKVFANTNKKIILFYDKYPFPNYKRKSMQRAIKRVITMKGKIFADRQHFQLPFEILAGYPYFLDLTVEDRKSIIPGKYYSEEESVLCAPTADTQMIDLAGILSNKMYSWEVFVHKRLKKMASCKSKYFLPGKTQKDIGLTPLKMCMEALFCMKIPIIDSVTTCYPPRPKYKNINRFFPPKKKSIIKIKDAHVNKDFVPRILEELNVA